MADLVCEWAEGCTAPGQVYEYQNVLGAHVRATFCPEHMARLRDPQALADLTERWAGMGLALTAREVEAHPLQKALIAHDHDCHACGIQRRWEAGEVLAGRFGTGEHNERFGYHAIATCCDEGLRLREALGNAMMGL